MVSAVTSIKELAMGIVAGIASMLPGISGATVCVAFGIYERLIRDMAYLRKWIRKDFAFLMILLIGVLIGTVLVAKVLNILIDDYPAECMMFFGGLILGQVPMIYASAKGDGAKTTSAEWLAFAVGMAVMAVMILVDHFGGMDDVEVGTDAVGCVILFVIGMIVIVSMMLPGLSHSTLLISIGYFAAFTEIVGDLKVTELCIMLLGGLVAVFLFSKLIHLALEDHHGSTMFLILGLTVGSIVAVLAYSVDYVSDPVELAVSAVLFVIGLLFSYRFMKAVDLEDSSEKD
ncbi:MAG: DUF368 domain-containing protein [Thermoplasmata archaeon]|nr:DUF368 domain-containing protein [Thermoplasmata archaeon]